ncbi:MAG TPA: CBS domain-containing protein [Aquihabitans sp.]|jgi:CBS domain-containing protein|nr:CBS domain-containing protein [Aquihabitans sp.]
MQVSVLLQGKGGGVVTVGPDTPTSDVVATLAEHRIGAVVVSGDGQGIDGVLSERDVVRALAGHGVAALERPASAWMTTEVVTCGLDTTVEQLMATMTDRRIRHVPVVVDGVLAGVVSIGDVVKDRISALEHETQVLHDYIANPF